ncbi:hypothetical protein EFW17_20265 [Halostreptopolyspora alba]|uniref:Uncharacterized protein n=2 Tax=Halostreptopolyspora alba TaxID=2487137 RepID=A0A3N0E2N1_9ACTN|nr:hypothetical protein EFW17_20265 [Nocardiopsaceae bacterium YIM 96095]
MLVFGTVGALLIAALLGLLLVSTGRSAGRGVPVALGATALAVLLAVPTLAASNVVAAGGRAGFGLAFLVAFGVVALTYVVNVALLPLMSRRVAAVHGTERASRLYPSGGTLAGGLLICAAFGLVGASIAVLVG